jgi:hypothetical protein
MPRFRTEVGPFVGMAGSIDGRRIDGGFTETQSGSGWIGGVDLSLRAGVGLDGVIGESGDGLVFVSLGLRADSPSTNAFDASALAQQGGSITAAIPARTGLSTRIRMPFFLIPGDLLLAAPLYFFSPDSYTAMAVTASNGGLIPWQSGWATPYGRFQFVLGRELGVNFYGLQGNDRILAPPAEPGGQVRLVKYKSTYYDLPILEYRPYRAFASNQSSTILVQLFAGLDVPQGESVVSPAGAPPVDVSRNVWSVGLRLVFDWRYYP